MERDRLCGQDMGVAWGANKERPAAVVPLSPAAIAVLKAIPRKQDVELVFPARGKSDIPYYGYSKGKRSLDALAGMHDWTLHDLRRTAATGMARLGVAPHVVERILNHTSGTFGGVAGVNNRFHYLDEMREGLARWESHLTALLRKADEKIDETNRNAP